MDSKNCTQCNITKPLTEFYLDRTIFTKISYRSKCKKCNKINQDLRKKHNIDETLKFKICSICQINKSTNDFYKSFRHKDGYFSFCGLCHVEKTKNITVNPGHIASFLLAISPWHLYCAPPQEGNAEATMRAASTLSSSCDFCREKVALVRGNCAHGGANNPPATFFLFLCFLVY
jgi:hypothetical protein